MLTPKTVTAAFLSLIIGPCVTAQLFPNDFSFNPNHRSIGEINRAASYDKRALQKDAFLDALVANMTVLELGK